MNDRTISDYKLTIYYPADTEIPTLGINTLCSLADESSHILREALDNENYGEMTIFGESASACRMD
jgi:hypothetical protein